jgi:putative transposase
MSECARYQTDLTDAEWTILEPLLPPARQDVRPRKYEMREVINAIRYLQRTGCAWRLLPHDFPPYRSVFYYFSLWRRMGVWEQIHNALHALVRQKSGREAQPSAGSADSQSVKTTQKGGSWVMTGQRR